MPPKALDLWLIDAFTDRRFAGNPAGVCLLAAPAPEEWMQQVAREMNQAETAFLVPREEGWDLRWFTPVAEVDLCGHATLASAHFLWQRKKLPAKATAHFHTRSGILTAVRRGDWIELDFPAMPAEPVEPPPYLLDGVKSPEGESFKGTTDYLVVLGDARKLRALAPDLRLLRAVEARGVIVTAPADRPGIDFVSRFFAPAYGVDEDPVTGSAHCTLAPYWAARLGKAAMVGEQASPRGGIVRVEVAGDRVRLGGQAVTVVKGTIEP